MEEAKSKATSNIFWIGLSFAAILAAAFYGMKTKSLRSELETAISDNEELVVKSERVELREIDEMLLDGRYSEAIRRSGELDMTPDFEDDSELAFRLRMAEQLAEQRNRRPVAVENIVERRLVDTVERVVERTVMPANSKTDSLTFALEKAEVQLNIIKKQLKERSAGAYLTFKTKKGNSLHYVGEVKNGKAQGYGIAILDSGSRYEGEWNDNMRHGKGVFFWSDGEHYEGEYVEDQRSGTGIYYWTNGEKYIGDWEGDKRNGRGKFYDKKGDVKASGVWKDDKLDEVDKK